MQYRKAFKQQRQEKAGSDSDTGSCDADEPELMLVEGHPGCRHAYLQERAHLHVPLLSVPDGHLCPLKDLRLGSVEVTPDTEKHRERYAMTALLLFHPFRHLEDLQTDGSYWTTFDTCRTKHFLLMGRGSSPAGSVLGPDKPDAPSFWSKGFDMLQNMEETSSVGKNISRTVDSLTWETTCRHEEEDNTTDEKMTKMTCWTFLSSARKRRVMGMQLTTFKMKGHGTTLTHRSSTSPMELGTELWKPG